MRIVLVGADLEENLGLGMIAASAELAGHQVAVVPFNEPGRAAEVVGRALAEAPEVIGLGIQFQHRAREFLALARDLREAGYQGHLTCGGQFPTMAYREVLSDGYGVDTVVLHEGEGTFADLLEALERGQDPAMVPGLAVVRGDGTVDRTTPRPLADLDALPFPKRYRPHTCHVGLPFIPIMGGRGCWGQCSFCSIMSFYRDARAYGGGKLLRLRSPRDVAAEMAVLWHAAGGAGIFCFHDDNFLLPRPKDSLERVTAIRRHLDAFGVGRIAIVGKARPDTLTPELACDLRDLGVIRLYVGVENASEAGAAHLKRGTQLQAVRDALRACRQAEIFACYNLLLFEPGSTLDDVRDNMAFIREHAQHPVNFCRAEPYYGTSLQRGLASEDALGGSYLGWNYRIDDDRTETLFRVCAAAFRERNFDCGGVANRYMGVGYAVKVLDHFHPDPGRKIPALARRATALTRDISLDSADLLEHALDLVEHADLRDRERIEAGAARLGLRIAARDRGWHRELDRMYGDLNAFSEELHARRVHSDPPGPLLRVARSVAFGASLAVWATGCDSCKSTPPEDQVSGDQVPPTVVDPAPADTDVVPPDLVGDPPPPHMVVDPVPPDPVPPELVVDPVPADPVDKQDSENMRRPVGDPVPPPILEPIPEVEPVADPVPPPTDLPIPEVEPVGDPVPPPPDHPPVVDPPPPPQVLDPVPIPADPPPPPADPPPPPIGDPLPQPIGDPVPPPPPNPPPTEEEDAGSDAGAVVPSLIDQWRDTAPRHTARSADLPLCDPPRVELVAVRRGDRIHLALEGSPDALHACWEADGALVGEGREVVWTPKSPSDQVRVAVRTPGGVAILSRRAGAVS
jgi:methylmalonyl-CoA mutase cobalamin-binding subunit